MGIARVWHSCSVSPIPIWVGHTSHMVTVTVTPRMWMQQVELVVCKYGCFSPAPTETLTLVLWKVEIHPSGRRSVKPGRSREKALLCRRGDSLRSLKPIWLFLGASHLLGHYYSSPCCHVLP